MTYISGSAGGQHLADTDPYRPLTATQLEETQDLAKENLQRIQRQESLSPGLWRAAFWGLVCWGVLVAAWRAVFG